VPAQVAAAGATPRDPLGPPPIWSYSAAFVTVGPLIKLLWRIKYLHADRVPGTGPVLLAANHRSFLDPPAVALGLPMRRPVRFMAKAEMFAKQPGKWLLPAMMSFPVHRETADRTAIKAALAVLADNGMLGMFPEGTRVADGATASAQLGVAFIAMRAKAKIVPVGIVGTDKAMGRGKKVPSFPPVTIAYGEPIDPTSFDDLPKDQRLAALTTAVMQGIESAMNDATDHKRSR
jgi:1-acyl-sn-glycerol-3-phosphate acyltransferase